MSSQLCSQPSVTLSALALYAVGLCAAWSARSCLREGVCGSCCVKPQVSRCFSWNARHTELVTARPGAYLQAAAGVSTTFHSSQSLAMGPISAAPPRGRGPIRPIGGLLFCQLGLV